MNPADRGCALFARREARLAALDALPRSLWLGSLVNSQGTLEPRLNRLQDLRSQLVAGALGAPGALSWPGPPLAGAIHTILLQLALPAWCRQRDALTDQILSSLLWHLDRIVDYIDRGDQAQAAAQRALEAFREDWQQRRAWADELEAVFGPAEELFKHTRWDLLRGLLRSEGWQEVLRARRLIESLPVLAEAIRRLGRARPSEQADDSRAAQVALAEPITVPRPEVQLVRVPEMPGETRGVFRSGRIARMLPTETMLLTHRRLRLVWHAHHAERALLTYEDDDRLRESVVRPMPAWRTRAQRRPERRLEAGPMLVCVDTSGSMQGGAEAVAKAVVLEAMRTAHAQRRACRAYAFGGPDEILELELALDAEGIGALSGFFSQAFHGGTDICGPLERVLVRIAEKRWQLADLLVASDGEFGPTPGTVAAVNRAKAELGLRVQAILIGDRESIGMLELADEITWVRDWRRYGGSEAGSPVHSKSLTALYFPGALRPPG